jgi:CHAD domain-containing protein
MSKPLAITWDEPLAAADNARKYLPPLVADYFDRGRELLSHHTKPAEMHTLRLATKRLRYTLELFRPCYGPGLGIRIKALREMQQLLGEINDTVAAERTLDAVLTGKSPQRTRLESFLRRQGELKTARFRTQWREVFDAPGQERWWIGYLARRSRKAAGKA